MAYFINEQKMIDDNTFMFEERIKAPTSRFIDGGPTFTTYFHINNNESTVDEGFSDVHTVFGKKSPIKFDRIENLPMYGMDQMVMQIQDDENGITVNYENDAIILPQTIKPLPNDCFIIPTLKDAYLFRITNIVYDSIMTDNFYKIEFSLHSISQEIIDDIMKYQVLSNNVCLLENIGTDTRCIIESDSYVKINEINKMYHNIIDFYKALFYNERHNVFLCEYIEGRYVYDALQTEFINTHNLFKEKNSLDCLYLTNEYDDPKRKYKYAKSIYKFIELRDMKLLSQFPYTLKPGMSVLESSFNKWHDKSIDIMEYPDFTTPCQKNTISEDFMLAIKLNGDVEHEYANLIKRFVRKEDIKINEISLNLDEELIYRNDSLEVFIFTPIIMYIIREIIHTELKRKKD